VLDLDATFIHSCEQNNRMSAFEYNKVDFSAVADVSIISKSSQEYRSFLSDVYDSHSKPQYEKWVQNYPDVAQKYKILAEHALENPIQVAEELKEAQLPSNRTCSDCWNCKNDEYRDGENKKVCWENKPPNNGNRPRKISADDDLAKECPYFSPKDEAIESEGVDSRLAKQHYIKQLISNDDDKRRKAALKFAYYQSWGVHGPKDTKKHTFNPNREEAMLREIGSEKADRSKTPGKGGREFEESVYERITEGLGLIPKNRVFKIHKLNSEVHYKEMDVHLKVSGEPVIAELFTQRIASRKQEQLEDYADLFEIATGTEPETYLVTDEIIRRDWCDGEEKVEYLDKGDAGEITLELFEERLRKRKMLENGRNH